MTSRERWTSFAASVMVCSLLSSGVGLIAREYGPPHAPAQGSRTVPGAGESLFPLRVSGRVKLSGPTAAATAAQMQDAPRRAAGAVKGARGSKVAVSAVVLGIASVLAVTAVALATIGALALAHGRAPADARAPWGAHGGPGEVGSREISDGDGEDAGVVEPLLSDAV